MYRINEIFYSIQGEGALTGTAAVFVRFSGCNLKCPFCDTDFKDYKEMSAKQIAGEVKKIGADCDLIVITGGEPTIQYDLQLSKELKSTGKKIAIETNGTHEISAHVDWITISPKQAYVGDTGKLKLHYCDELKVVYDGEHEPETYNVIAKNYFIQPCDKGFIEPNKHIMEACVEYIKQHPRWRLSLQTQKIINVR